jgi:cytochrome c oxidase subunit 1
LGFSSIFTGLNFIATVHALRAPGMTFFRMPLFVWALYATSVIQVLATPVLGITLLLLIAEKVLRIGIFDPAIGGDPILFQHFFWFYSHPAVYIMIVPGFGVISDLISTFSRKAIFGYRAIAMSSIGIAIVGFLVWGHHMFTSGQSELAEHDLLGPDLPYRDPDGHQDPELGCHALQGLDRAADTRCGTRWASCGCSSIGGLTGLYLATMSLDLHLHDTYFVVAHFHYVMMGGTMFAFIGGLHYWWPKITGRMYSEKLGNMACLLAFIGFNMTFMSQFFLGVAGHAASLLQLPAQYEPLHQVLDDWFVYVLGFGFLLTAICLLSSLKSGAQAGDNPWGGTTLEWQTPSPPPLENFVDPPVVTAGPYDRGTAASH